MRGIIVESDPLVVLLVVRKRDPEFFIWDISVDAITYPPLLQHCLQTLQRPRG